MSAARSGDYSDTVIGVGEYAERKAFVSVFFDSGCGTVAKDGACFSFCNETMRRANGGDSNRDETVGNWQCL